MACFPCFSPSTRQQVLSGLCEGNDQHYLLPSCPIHSPTKTALLLWGEALGSDSFPQGMWT